MFFEDDMMIPTNLTLAILVVVILVLLVVTMSAVFYGNSKSESMKDLPLSNKTQGLFSGPDVRFVSGTSQVGLQGEPFIGGPEPPRFYEIGDVQAVRKSRESFEDPTRWQRLGKTGEMFSDAELMRKNF